MWPEMANAVLMSTMLHLPLLALLPQPFPRLKHPKLFHKLDPRAPTGHVDTTGSARLYAARAPQDKERSDAVGDTSGDALAEGKAEWTASRYLWTYCAD